MSAHITGSLYELNRRMKEKDRMYTLLQKPVHDVGPKRVVEDTKKLEPATGNSFHNANLETRKNQLERAIFGVNSLRAHL